MEYARKLNKEFIIDPRYEALIAGLLKPVRGNTFYKNINFLTWNYDANLFVALRNFVAPKESLNDFIKNRFNEKYLIITPQVRLFHLNGFVLHPLLNKIGEGNLSSHFSDVIHEYEQHQLVDYSKYIKFAWEQHFIDFQDISKIIFDSSTLINIGYSFPLYNRVFDSILINEQTLRYKQLYIQNIDTSSIKNILESDFKIPQIRRSGEDPQVTFSESCNSFIIPNHIFN